VFGTALHITLQEYLTVLYEESKAAADRLDSETTLKNSIRDEYQNFYDKNKKIHFSNAAELAEFYEDGMNIINYVRKKSGTYFSKRGWYLVGCEMPLVLKPTKNISNVLFGGFLDVVFYHEPTNTIKILDIKTSTRGWGDKDKKDDVKTSKLVLYKNLCVSMNYTKNICVFQRISPRVLFILSKKNFKDKKLKINSLQTFF
jgi:hypothetical protein